MYASAAGKRQRSGRRGARGASLVALALGAALISSEAAAQPASLDPKPGAAPASASPASPAAPAAGAPAAGATPAPGTPGSKVPIESVDSNQTLGDDPNDRPWVAGVSEADQAAALRLFRDGNASLNDGVFVTAVKHYRQALKHWDHPAIHYNLALALMNLNQPLEVYESLTKALKYDPKVGPAPLDADKYDRAKNYMLLAKNQVANVDITCDKPGAKVSVDGNVVFTGPGRYQGLVKAGKHSFVAEKEGYVTSVEAPYIGPGETMRFALKLYSERDRIGHKRLWKATWAPWTVAGAGGAIAIAAGVLYFSGRADIQDFDARIAQCGLEGCPITSDLTDMRDSGNTKQTMAWVGFGLGAATIATGFTLVYLNRLKPYQRSLEEIQKEEAAKLRASSATSSIKDSLRLTPVLGPDVAGAAASFRF
jgi:tetratricopeptide (TPR) repeat protein